LTQPLLSVKGIVAGYGEVLAVRGASLDVVSGSITALLGSNGAGKTTLLRAIAGLIRAREGSIRFEESDLSSLECHQRVARGIVIVPEGRMLFPRISVEDNLRMGSFTPRARRQSAEMFERVYELFPRLQERRRQYAGTLSGGEQQMLALGRGLMAQPKLLLLDEPTLGLSPLMAQLIFRVIRKLNEDGLTILIAEQDVRRTLSCAHRGYVLENGRYVMEGTGTELLGDPKISQAYLGM
jgi:branched-chain amino acid transport system ATP-binding protein